MSQLQSVDTGLFETMVAAAIEAGSVTHGIIYRGDCDVQRKADESPVTGADHAAEAIILERLVEAAPRIPFIAAQELAAGGAGGTLLPPTLAA
jgi:3'(2'), 5'-bisphosphate nucleotidase